MIFLWENQSTLDCLDCFKSRSPDFKFYKILFNSLAPWWYHLATWNLVSIGSGNGLLPDGAKSLLEPLLADYQWVPLALIWVVKILKNKIRLRITLKNKISATFIRGQWVKMFFFGFWHGFLGLCYQEWDLRTVSKMLRSSKIRNLLNFTSEWNKLLSVYEEDIFVLNFKGYLWNVTKIFNLYMERYDFLYNIDIIRPLRFKSSYTFLMHLLNIKGSGGSG